MVDLKGKSVTPEDLNKKNVYYLLSDPDTRVTTVHALALVVMGENLYHHDIGFEDIALAFLDAFNVDVDDTLLNKLMALVTAMTSDAYFEDPEAFISISNSISGGDPGMDFFDELTYAEMVESMVEVSLNIRAEYMQEFSPEVQKVIAEVNDNEAYEEDEVEDAEAIMDQSERLVFELKMQILSELVGAGFNGETVVKAFELT